MKPCLSVSADLKLLPMDEKTDWSRIFEIRDNPIQDRHGSNNKCSNRNPSVVRISDFVLKIFYCPGTNNPKAYLIDLEEIGVDVNDWFNLKISVSRKTENGLETKTKDGAAEQSENYEFEIQLAWKNISYVVPGTPVQYKNAKITKNADFYITKKSKVQVRNFESTGMSFITQNSSLW